MLETELKLDLDEVTERRLLRDRRLAVMSRGRPARRMLRSIYYDTVSRDLARAGMALRLRKEGRLWTQTIKLAQEMRGGLSRAEEHNCPAPGGRLVLDSIADAEVAETLRATLDGRALSPVFETRIRRITRIVDLPGAVVEMAFDRGEILAGERVEPLSELELELVEGRVSGLYQLLRQILPPGAVRFSPCSKAARGMRLADGLPEPAPAEAPRRAAPVALTASQTAEEAARDILREAVAQISGNLAWLGTAEGKMDPEGLKQLRVGLRRLRTSLKVFRDEIGGAAATALAEEARWLAGEVGRVRDLDVVLAEIVEPEMARGEEPGFRRLFNALQRSRQKARAALTETLAAPRVDGFVLDLTGFIEARGWLDGDDLAQTRRLAAPVCAVARRALDKRWRRTRKLARDMDSMDIEARHELRKDLKKLRYAIEYLRELYPEDSLKPFLKQLKRLQAVFGDLNDAAMAEAMFLGPDAVATSDPLAQRAVGRLIGSRIARSEAVWGEAQVRWQELGKTATFWRETRKTEGSGA
ncbi:MAG: CYTH and CHAD domain-containing protein [Pseudomonadota bacterium]